MKAVKIREHTVEELRQLLDDKTRELLTVKARKGMGEGAEHPMFLRNLRRDLARIKTVMKERGGKPGAGGQ